MPKVVTFGEIMLRLSPPGYERFLQSPVFGATFGRRRGECGRQPRAVRPRELLRHAAAEARHRRGRGARAARGRRQNRFHHSRRRSRRRLLRRGGRQPARIQRHLRSRAFGHQRARARNGGLGEGISGSRLVSRHGHHAGTRREGGCVHARVDRSGEEGRREGVGRSEFPQEALDRGAGAEGDAPADASRRCRDRERRRHAVGAWARSPEHRRDVRSLESRWLSRASRSVCRRSSGRRWSRLRCARACPPATTGGAPCSGTTRPASSCKASTTTCGSSIGSAAATVSRRV